MKTRSFLAAVAMLVSGVVFAQEQGSGIAVARQKQSDTFKVTYEGGQSGDVKLSVWDTEGSMISFEMVRNTQGFSRLVKFGGLRPGDYTIRVQDIHGEQVRKVSYDPGTAIRFVHVSRMANQDKYLLTVNSLGPEQINVRIFDGTNELVHSENRTVPGDFGLVYNLEKITGLPTFEVTDKAGKVRKIKY